MIDSPLGGAARRTSATHGFTLTVLAAVLTVCATLVLVLVPSIADYVSDSRVARTRADTQALAAAVMQFYTDNGFFPSWSVSNSGGPGTVANRVDLLVSRGNVPAATVPNLWTTGTTTTVEDQLIANTPAYALKSASSPFGWDGPYLPSAIGPDAWNNRYMINIGLADTTRGTQSAAGPPSSAVWVISAGSNGRIETPFSQPVTSATVGGDDIAARIQ